ncbi:hypothetical protein [Dactylosporangium matsuzakiense]|uniref:hypothetical protein n=1 Tax=Dactylosporangium matsuzakiense TaxID=53360 RepID=UPI0021C26046|nr:hypothetical protein [Dactylosporangium matsuzakiense]UWZ48143.1 hypothetical protein Dmats_18105 [Dactylosporangium matsuzakiense]
MTRSRPLDGEMFDVSFDDLGYDAIALMETAGRICTGYSVVIETIRSRRWKHRCSSSTW